jgi:hypothetical protein
MGENNGWLEYKQRVLFQLDELQKLCSETNIKLDKLREDVLILKTKAGIYGAIGGIITAAIISILVKHS